MDVLKNLLGNERSFVFLALIIAATVLTALGKMTIDQWQSYSQVVFGIWAGSSALHGGLSALGGGTGGSGGASAGGASAPAAPAPADKPVDRAAKASTTVLVLAFAAVLFVGCGSRVGQVTLKTGQCILDSGVEAALLADLADKNYAQLVGDAVTKFGPTLVNCALQAIADTAPQAGSGALTTADATSVQARAKEMLGKLGGAK